MDFFFFAGLFVKEPCFACNSCHSTLSGNVLVQFKRVGWCLLHDALRKRDTQPFASGGVGPASRERHTLHLSKVFFLMCVG